MISQDTTTKYLQPSVAEQTWERSWIAVSVEDALVRLQTSTTFQLSLDKDSSRTLLYRRAHKGHKRTSRHAYYYYSSDSIQRLNNTQDRGLVVQRVSHNKPSARLIDWVSASIIGTGTGTSILLLRNSLLGLKDAPEER